MKKHECNSLPDWRELPPAKMIASANAFLARMQERHTVRQFSDRPAPHEVIEAAVRTAGTAPSGANHQPLFFSIIGSSGLKKELRQRAEAEGRAFCAGKGGEEWLDALSPLGTNADKPYLETAPWIIAIFGQRKGGVRKGVERQNYCVPESVGMAAGFMIAALHHAGVATLTHTPKPMTFLNGMCDRPLSEKLHLLLVFGYLAEAPPCQCTPKEPFEEIAALL